MDRRRIEISIGAVRAMRRDCIRCDKARRSRELGDEERTFVSRLLQDQLIGEVCIHAHVATTAPSVASAASSTAIGGPIPRFDCAGMPSGSGRPDAIS